MLIAKKITGAQRINEFKSRTNIWDPIELHNRTEQSRKGFSAAETMNLWPHMSACERVQFT